MLLNIQLENDTQWWQIFSTRMSHTRWRRSEWKKRCSYCNALLLNTEHNGFCCSNGKAISPPLPPLPQGIVSITNQRNISPYSHRLNSLFSFTAIGASKGFQSFQTGIWNIAITGRTYHHLFDISSVEHSLHWYLYDEEERRIEGINRKLPLSWIQIIENDLRNVNPYVDHLRRFSSTWSNDVHAISALELSDVSVTGDFAAIMHADNSTDVSPRSIVIWNNSQNDPSFIPIFSRHYEPLQYPLLFPQGTLGWGLIPDQNDHLINNLSVTQREWYKNRLLTDDRFLLFGRLTSEYLCDMYSRIEEERLQFVRRGRVHEALAHDFDDQNETIDIRLPVSFLGSREWSSSETADALALAREYGPPSFFITMTCNSDWPEITERLRPGQNAYDVPTIVVRAFKSRLERLIHILNVKFGQLLYIIHIIEFQKRGFPHAHIVAKVFFPSSFNLIYL